MVANANGKAVGEMVIGSLLKAAGWALLAFVLWKAGGGIIVVIGLFVIIGFIKSMSPKS